MSWRCAPGCKPARSLLLFSFFLFPSPTCPRRPFTEKPALPDRGGPHQRPESLILPGREAMERHGDRGSLTTLPRPCNAIADTTAPERTTRPDSGH
ncbi:hypothetical protein BKA56DRAFT_318133 [Ilyonectria sp. MPI-CAGE-AT-0026]|nr:hypothetical protein BKA56DRAFT_318133 [Ilyonectria sp. MPI-CAGE-AT-0026]